jgi:hypothetical protein
MICHDTPGGEVAQRYHTRIWLEEGKVCTSDLLPEPVGLTICAAIERGMTSGTVEYLRTYRKLHLDATTPELYCWELE